MNKDLHKRLEEAADNFQILEIMTKEELNKACEWLDNTLPDIEYITNASALRQNKKQFIDTFCKAMKED